MFKVNNRNTRKRCLLISKITLKTLERCHLSTSYLLEVAVQNHILDSLQSQFAIKSLLSVLLSSSAARNLIADPYMSFYEKEETISELFEKFKMSAFSISEKTAPKRDIFFNFLRSKGYISVSQS